MIKSVNQYKAYFAALAAAKGLSFVYGGSERIINRQAMDIQYPCLWLGIPEIRRKREGGLKKIFDGWFIILTDAATDDYAEQDNNLDEMEKKTEELIAQMSDDALALQFEFDAEDAVSHYRARQTADDAWGWFTEFQLTGLHKQNSTC